MKNLIKQSLDKTVEIVNKIANDAILHEEIFRISEECISALKNNKKILLAGNGGSAADAQHIAAELVSRFLLERRGLPAIAITTDSSILTAIGNDYGFENIFSRQIEALGQRGDVFIAYSTSGKSLNIIKALEVASGMGLMCVGLTGSCNSKMLQLCDYKIQIPSSITSEIQEGHLIVGHIICNIIENKMFLK
jgi:D-sedoheptulose 7-phosphate isomerase